MKYRSYVTTLMAATFALAQLSIRAQNAPPPKHVVDSAEIVLDHDSVQHQVKYVGADNRRTGEVSINAIARLHAGMAGFGAGQRSGQTLLIRTTELSPEAQAELQEDLNVMSRILDKATEGESARGPSAMGIDLVFGSGTGPVRSLYLEGYGALFMVNVNIPLLSPPTPPENETSETESETETAWEQARQELYGVPLPPDPGTVVRWVGELTHEQVYSEEKVEQLRKNLLEAMKNATNIRQLAADDAVTVCVFGAPVAGPQLRNLSSTENAPRKKGDSAEAGRTAHAYAVVLGKESESETRAVMTLQAKKADLDRFARGEITLDQLRDRTQTQIYPGAPGGWNPPNQLFWNGR